MRKIQPPNRFAIQRARTMPTMRRSKPAESIARKYRARLTFESDAREIWLPLRLQSISRRNVSTARTTARNSRHEAAHLRRGIQMGPDHTLDDSDRRRRMSVAAREGDRKMKERKAIRPPEPGKPRFSAHMGRRSVSYLCYSRRADYTDWQSRKMKIAVVHDWLNGMRGGEKVLEAILELYPQSAVYTLFHQQRKVSRSIESHRIVTSWLNRIPGINRYYRYLLPLF